MVSLACPSFSSLVGVLVRKGGFAKVLEQFNVLCDHAAVVCQYDHGVRALRVWSFLMREPLVNSRQSRIIKFC